MVRFEIADCPSESLERLRVELGVSGPLAQALVRRGLCDPHAARAFLDASEHHDLGRFGGLERAAALVMRHVGAGSRVTIHGDYDVDGVCSTAILLGALRDVGASVDWHLPDRAEGYGLSLATVERLAARGTGLLITADCGITAVEEVAAARAAGMDVIVSDHHLPRVDGALPDATIVHPLLGGYPCPDLCAAAVAHKLGQAIWSAAGRDPAELERDLDLVALATIADVVPLRGENRTLARQGLKALSATPKPGLRALMSVARLDAARIDERAVGFGLGPRLNAAGRLYRADAALELLLTDDRVRAVKVAEELDRANAERRQAEQRIRIEAEAQMAAVAGERAAYVLSGEGWHPGVIGIVASRLAERHGRPVVLVSLDGERARGSGRSIKAFDLVAGLSACAEHLLRYGGHAAAAGVELERESVERFAAALDAHAGEALSGQDLQPVERVDALVSAAELDMALAEELRRLAPFGNGNPSVSLMVNDAVVADLRTMGEGKHARFLVQSGGAHARAVAFGRGAQIGVGEGEPAQATFTLEVNEWNGVSEPRLVLRHAQPVAAGVVARTLKENEPGGEEATIEPCPTVRGAQSTLFPLPEPVAVAAAPS
jgi:single-stranded-DNA-specific exonuclease